MATRTDDGRITIPTEGDGALMALPYDGDLSRKAIEDELSRKAEAPGEATTPDPTDDGDTQSRTHRSGDSGGPIRRINDVITDLGSTGLETLALDALETAKAVSKRSDELYRNEFPIITPRYQAKCEACGSEFDSRPEPSGDDTDAGTDDASGEADGEEEAAALPDCPECGEHALRAIDQTEKADLNALADDVNREGQSLRELAKLCEDDHSRIGVGTMVVKWAYSVAGSSVSVGGDTLMEQGDIVSQRFDELVRGDPKRIVPVVDENGRIGNYWFACPIHRRVGEDATHDQQVHDEPGQCEVCGADLRDVHYVELGGAGGRSKRQTDIEKFYFSDEIVMWAHHIPRLNGLDGVSPVHLIWLQQSVLHWMNSYAAEYFNPQSDQTPNKFVVIHTTNKDAFEKQLDQAQADAEENPYANGIFYNEYGSQANSSPEVEVVDVMGDEFLGQSEEMRKRFESQIRTTFGLSDVHDSEMGDGGGLNNEGLQLEVTDRSVASAQQELVGGPYRELLDILGYGDWAFRFVPPREADLEERKQQLDVLHKAGQLGLDARLEDGEAVIGDGAVDASGAGDAFGLGGGGGVPGEGGAPPGQQSPPEGPDPPRDAQVDDEASQAARGTERDEVAAKADADPVVTDGGTDQHLRDMEAAFKHIVWPDPDAESLADISPKASRSYWDNSQGVPEYVQDAIKQAVNSGVVWAGLDDVSPLDAARFFKTELGSTEGWTLARLSEQFSQHFDVGISRAITVVRSEVAAILNKAREIGYRQEGKADARYYWQGPQDDSTTQACETLKTETNPAYDGEPVPLDDLEQRAREVSDEHFPDLDYREFQLHPAERHTFVEAK